MIVLDIFSLFERVFFSLRSPGETCDKHNTSEISISTSTRKRSMFLSLLVISHVQTRPYSFLFAIREST